MPNKAQSLKKKMIYGLLILTIIHLVTLILPFTVHVKVDEEKEQIITTYTNICDTPYVWIFAANFLMTALAVISFNTILMTIIHCIVIVWSLLLFLMLQYMFVWDGQPIHATFSYGYWLNQAVLLVLIVLTWNWQFHFKEVSPSKKYIRLLTLITIAVPVSLTLAIYLSVTSSLNEPILRSDYYFNTGPKLTKQELWDYSEAYGAYVTKYYSKDKPADSLKKELNRYQLDSISVTFYDDNSKVTKEFTKHARKGEMDIEAVLKDNSD